MGRKPQQITQGVIDGILNSAKKRGASRVILNFANGTSATVEIEPQATAPPSTENDAEVVL
jgi:hypothetical protein